MDSLAHTAWPTARCMLRPAAGALTQLPVLSCTPPPHVPQDTLQGYAGVFSMLVRLRRVEQLLRALHAPLAARPKSTPELLLRWAGCGLASCCVGRGSGGS